MNVEADKKYRWPPEDFKVPKGPAFWERETTDGTEVTPCTCDCPRPPVTTDTLVRVRRGVT